MKVWIILADPESSSCIVNAVYLDKERTEKWTEYKNKQLGFSAFWIEESQLIK